MIENSVHELGQLPVVPNGFIYVLSPRPTTRADPLPVPGTVPAAGRKGPPWRRESPKMLDCLGRYGRDRYTVYRSGLTSAVSYRYIIVRYLYYQPARRSLKESAPTYLRHLQEGLPVSLWSEELRHDERGTDGSSCSLGQTLSFFGPSPLIAVDWMDDDVTQLHRHS